MSKVGGKLEHTYILPVEKLEHKEILPVEKLEHM